MDWYLEPLEKYAVFTGRARRKEYWTFVLCNTLLAFVLAFIDGLMGTYNAEIGIGVLGSIFALAVLIPSFAVGVRRLHDSGKSGFLMLIVFVPVIGAIALLILMVLDSEPGENKHGPNPKA
ncbi:DUF805 domain-containing protein [Mucisphaera calidilacus]|uniref:Inner membrane protein YhaH n=1 Tax=Mucisphaera calidilacus TaxID=2527982 RepID=A0A518BWQ0_9BACT|nr:Inner membrane protein YhaH [Mucisphaera calidilacus]